MLDRVKGLVIATVIAVGSITSSMVFVTYAHAESPKQAYDTILLCKTPPQEDQVIDVKLAEFERTPEGLIIVFRCDEKY
jgi:hypothetical protein